MELQVNQVVQNNRGDIGYIAAFNGVPALVVYERYTAQPSHFNENLEHKNPNYSIVKVWDGSTLEKPSVIYRKKFDLSTLPVIWEKTK